LLSKLLRLAVSAILLTRLACRTDWGQVQAGFADLRWQYWLTAVVVLIAAQVASARRWQHYTDQLGLARPLGQLTGFYFIGMYFNLMLPTSVGGDVVRAWYLDGQSGRRLPAFASVIMDRVNGLLALVMMACIAVTLSPLALPSWIVLSFWTALACGIVGIAGARWFAQRAAATDCDEGPEDDADEPGVRLAWLQTSVAAFCSPRGLITTLLLSLGVQAANVLVVWLVGQAIHVPIPASFYWIMVPMVTLFTMLPISVNGMGVREEATVSLLAPLGIAEGAALTLSILWFAVHASVSLLGGVVYLLGHFPKPVLPRPTDQEGADGAAERREEVIRGPFGGDSDQGRTGQHRRAA
jgi:uncharacterized membrane protein YbhN (UPF0104 family)